MTAHPLEILLRRTGDTPDVIADLITGNAVDEALARHHADRRQLGPQAALKIRCLRSCPCVFVNNGLVIAIKLVTIHFHGFWVPRSGMTTHVPDAAGVRDHTT